MVLPHVRQVLHLSLLVWYHSILEKRVSMYVCIYIIYTLYAIGTCGYRKCFVKMGESAIECAYGGALVVPPYSIHLGGWLTTCWNQP